MLALIKKNPQEPWGFSIFRSAGRARTYNPAVNSRMFCIELPRKIRCFNFRNKLGIEVE